MLAHKIQQVRRALASPFMHQKIIRIAMQNCCETDERTRKPLYKRYSDLLYSFIRWNELSTLYFAQSLDIKGKHIGRDFLSYGMFREMRDVKNGTARSRSFNYACLLRDKVLFERYFSAGGIPVVPTVGHTDRNALILQNGSILSNFPDQQIHELDGKELFAKPRFGIKGKGAFKLQLSNGRASINGSPATADELRRSFSHPLIIQETVPQHNTLAILHTPSLNTIRTVTYRNNGKIESLLSYLRIAANGQITDNNPSCRAIVRINEQNGNLYKHGYVIREDVITKEHQHPNTGIYFRDLTVPFFSDAIETVKRAHEWLPSIHSIGWDIAITPSGPILLEGNDDWGATTAMWMMPDFKSRFMHAMQCS